MTIKTAVAIDPYGNTVKPKLSSYIPSLLIWPRTLCERTVTRTDEGDIDYQPISDIGCLDAPNRLPAGSCIKMAITFGEYVEESIYPSHCDRE